MFSFGLFVFLFGALALFGMLGMSIASPDVTTVNPEQMATREMFMTAASALCIVGAIFMGCGAIRNELRRDKLSSMQAKKGEKREPNLDPLQWPVEASQGLIQREGAARDGGGDRSRPNASPRVSVSPSVSRKATGT